MDGSCPCPVPREALREAQVAADDRDPAGALAAALGDGPFALVCLFASPDVDFDALAASTTDLWPGAEVLACTTAGEIGPDGYAEGTIVAVAFPAALFSVATHTVEGADALDTETLTETVAQARATLAATAPEAHATEFAMLLADGLSCREEHLTATLATGLGAMPLFGGSAGDGTRFADARLARNGMVMRDAALVTLVRSACAVRVFSLDHLVPTETRMVVTDADPERRLVREINAEPAAQEYARLLGKDPNQLDPFTFAAFPVVVRLGDTHHVRAIRQVTEDGALIFFSAISTGMVLTLAHPQDMATHLDTALAEITGGAADVRILGMDCILRRIEAGQQQQTRALSAILRRHNVRGFSSYGEQYGALHVNQTLTGVALFPPEAGAETARK
ncbi:hypothetical protein ATO8_01360 [Roseivivax marinus]|uniref:GfdT protein n=1 Tax=Roseivivax marinus TaxID=1379903 RepID=W4HR87_9RHOB|nr:FIST N-terminal domain-containing protein [Roseivivax marinus]ETW14515.1 hypothetical protein ATO8_01360 [Roseivivax marinus]